MKIILAAILATWSASAFADWQTYSNGYLDNATSTFYTRTLTGNISFQAAQQRCDNDGFRLPTWDEMQSGRNNGLAPLKKQNGDDPTWWFWTAEGRRFSLEGLHIPGNEAKTICAD